MRFRNSQSAHGSDHILHSCRSRKQKAGRLDTDRKRHPSFTGMLFQCGEKVCFAGLELVSCRFSCRPNARSVRHWHAASLWRKACFGHLAGAIFAHSRKCGRSHNLHCMSSRAFRMRMKHGANPFLRCTSHICMFLERQALSHLCVKLYSRKSCGKNL